MLRFTRPDMPLLRPASESLGMIPKLPSQGKGMSKVLSLSPKMEIGENGRLITYARQFSPLTLALPLVSRLIPTLTYLKKADGLKWI